MTKNDIREQSWQEETTSACNASIITGRSVSAVSLRGAGVCCSVAVDKKKSPAKGKG